MFMDRPNIVKMFILPKEIYRFNSIPCKNPNDNFLQKQRKNANIHVEPGRASNRALLKNQSKAKGITLPDFKIYYKATAIKRTWYLHKDKHIDQWYKTERPEINSTNAIN